MESSKEKKTWWNHRVVKHVEKDLSPALKKLHPKGIIWFAIHEVYYEDGEPVMCTEEPIKVIGDDKKGIAWTLEKMKKSLAAPILNYQEIVSKKRDQKDEAVEFSHRRNNKHNKTK